MPNGSIFARVLGMNLQLGEPSHVAGLIPRFHLEDFELYDAALDACEDRPFIAAVAKTRPTVIGSRNLVASVRHTGESMPVAICMERSDPGLKRALVSEGVPFVSRDGNAYLPFLGVQETPTPPLPEPKPLSPQAQRIALNLVAGRWDGVAASDLARLCGRSGASVTKYLREIEAVEPTLVRTSWRSRILENPGLAKGELLDVLGPFLMSPIAQTHRLALNPGTNVLVSHNALLSGMSALPFFSDLAHDGSRLVVMMEPRRVADLKTELGAEWQEAAWYDDAPLTIEEWTYPVDAPSEVSLPSTGIKCVDSWSLFMSLATTRHEDIRTEDAIEQLRGHICQQ